MSTLAVIWRASGLLFATGVESIVEVLPPLSCREVPAVPVWVRGLFCHRDRLIPLVDASTLIGRTPTQIRMANRVLVVRRSLGSSSDNWTVGLWVQCVLELERLEFESPGIHPGFATEAGRFLGPVASTRWGLVQLVKPAELFTVDEASVLSARLREAAA